ncbi:hypothetical protein B296_00032771 [Ensete ventricosum]|uniref:Uncharacterized protein n=1 Tax=Ensete ventricosum TaxID=4639 RepID=A0A426WVK8_ENSVE|nr:hypothetical protein B296_00032771 [Ensete ventricosum]
MTGRGVVFVLRTSWFNCSSWIRAKEITAIRVYGCRAFTSPRICGFRPSIKGVKEDYDGYTLRLEDYPRVIGDGSKRFDSNKIRMRQVSTKIVTI